MSVVGQWGRKSMVLGVGATIEDAEREVHMKSPGGKQ